MEKEQINQLLDKQRQYFYPAQLLTLIFASAPETSPRFHLKHEDQIHAALKKDLGKSNLKAICVRPDWCSPRSHIC